MPSYDGPSRIEAVLWEGLWGWFPSVTANTTECTSLCPAVRFPVVSGPGGGVAGIGSTQAGTRVRPSSHSTQAQNLRGRQKELSNQEKSYFNAVVLNFQINAKNSS